jgi:hypothetical protein
LNKTVSDKENESARTIDDEMDIGEHLTLDDLDSHGMLVTIWLCTFFGNFQYYRFEKSSFQFTEATNPT